MATVKIEVVAGGQTMTHSKTVSVDHLTRFIAATRFNLNLPQNMTDLDVLDTWAHHVLEAAKDVTRQYERGAASAAVTQIDFS